MRFEEALKAMREGKKVKHKGLYRPIYILEKHQAIVSDYIGKNDRVTYPHSVSHNDMFAEDWEIVDE